MITSLPTAELTTYVASQLETFFPDGHRAADLRRFVDRALERTAQCFAPQRRRGFRAGDDVAFDHLHTDQYAVFLYYLSNSIYREGGDLRIAAKCYALNKALHGLDVFYEVALPDVFAVQHPVGTVLGRADYGDYLFVYQGCLVGVGADGERPRLGRGTVLFGGSNVIGASILGDNVWVSAGTLLLDAKIPANSIAFGRAPDAASRPTHRDVLRDAFGIDVGA